jgi:hypothetical protein
MVTTKELPLVGGYMSDGEEIQPVSAEWAGLSATIASAVTGVLIALVITAFVVAGYMALQ